MKKNYLEVLIMGAVALSMLTGSLFALFNNLSPGFEYLYYHKYSYLRDFPDVHKSKSEQKLYLMLYF